MTDTHGPELQRLTRAIEFGPDFQLLFVEAPVNADRDRVRAAVHSVAQAAGLTITETTWDGAADAADLERRLAEAAARAGVVHVVGQWTWFTPARWDGLNVRRERIAEGSRARLVFWLRPEAVDEIPALAPTCGPGAAGSTRSSPRPLLPLVARRCRRARSASTKV